VTIEYLDLVDYLAIAAEVTGLSAVTQNDAAKESNLPSRGLPGPAGFEDRMGHQARAAPREILGG